MATRFIALLISSSNSGLVVHLLAMEQSEGVCPCCPIQPKAIRHYNGIEFRVTKNGNRGFISAFYTLQQADG